MTRSAGALAIVLLGCGGAGDVCAGGLDAACAPLYDPTFDRVYANTLHATCAQSGASCHSATGHMGGLAYDDPDTAYALLTGAGGGRARVRPGDPSCSLLVVRIEGDAAGTQMPPGMPLPAAERCAIEQWIRAGASR